MRCTIAGHSFHLQPSDVERAVAGIEPESIEGYFVQIGRRKYPVRQVGALVTGQSRQDFTTAEVRIALTRLGFTCGPAS
jgi:hypothetical protein